MVIPTFRTWVAGEVVTAAYMNSNVRDGGNFFLGVPIAELRQTAAQSIPHNLFTPILLDTEDLDTDGGHSTVTNTSRYTPQTAGWFQYSGGTSYTGNATGGRGTAWYKNGSGVNGSEILLQTPGAGLSPSAPARTNHIFANGSTDYCEVVGYQNSGGALNTNVAATSQSNMSVRFVHT